MPVPTINALTIADIFRNTEELSYRNNWPTNTERRLKALAGEVIELAVKEGEDRTGGEPLCWEAFDVIWNAIDYLRLKGYTPEQINEGFKAKIIYNDTRWVPKGTKA